MFSYCLLCFAVLLISALFGSVLMHTAIIVEHVQLLVMLLLQCCMLSLTGCEVNFHGLSGYQPVL